MKDKLRSRVWDALNYDITVEDIVGEERYSRIKGTKAYKRVSDWAGLASNKVILGMYMDAKAGLLPGTSVLARGISLGVHTPTSPLYTKTRDFVYDKGNIHSNKSKLTRYGAELLAFNSVQTPLYIVQIAAAMAARALIDPSIDFEPEVIANGAFKFFANSWWLGSAGKWSMDGFRRFFGAKTPEQLAEEETKTNLEETLAELD